MAQRVQVMLVCDLHDEEVEGEETIAFGLDGTSYEIDVCGQHAAEMRDALAPYVGAARRAGRAAPGAPRRSGNRAGRSAAAPAAGGGAAGKERVQDIREWARQNGHSVSDRGRLSAAVVSAYEAAH